MSILSASQVHLVGIKGVAMTSLAQLLVDAGKRVSGSDIAEQFVTQLHLDRLGIEIQEGFSQAVPPETQAVVYTAAHSGQFNPQVQAARRLGLPTLSHAEALAELFNEKTGIAVCGVGGKSTTSAMIAWILEHTGRHPSYSVGVGNIPGFERTGRWNTSSDFFVAEADEYVTDPSAPQRGEPITPRFSFLKPTVTVCTGLAYDHPDVYRDFTHTLSVFESFFQSIRPGGTLILPHTLQDLSLRTSATQTRTFGGVGAQVVLTPEDVPGANRGVVTWGSQHAQLELSIPGVYNLENAVAAVTAATTLGVSLKEACSALASFRSTQRRFEYIRKVNGVEYFDDYAHHPREIAAVIKALNSWRPTQKKIIAFQPHTFSRTRELLSEFAASFAEAETVLLLDIFASARETADSSISTDLLAEQIRVAHPNISVENVHSISALAEYCHSLPEGTTVLTIGAGDIYKVHEHLNNDK